MVEREAWNHDGCGLGLPGDLLDEMLHHVVWAREKCRGFVGRDALVQQAMTMITSQTVASTSEQLVNDWSGITVSVLGQAMTIITSQSVASLSSSEQLVISVASLSQ